MACRGPWGWQQGLTPSPDCPTKSPRRLGWVLGVPFVLCEGSPAGLSLTPAFLHQLFLQPARLVVLLRWPKHRSSEARPRMWP